MTNKAVIYKSALDFLSILKKGGRIKTQPQLERLKFVMENLESFIYEEKIVKERSE